MQTPRLHGTLEQTVVVQRSTAENGKMLLTRVLATDQTRVVTLERHARPDEFSDVFVLDGTLKLLVAQQAIRVVTPGTMGSTSRVALAALASNTAPDIIAIAVTARRDAVKGAVVETGSEPRLIHGRRPCFLIVVCFDTRRPAGQ